MKLHAVFSHSFSSFIFSTWWSRPFFPLFSDFLYFIWGLMISTLHSFCIELIEKNEIKSVRYTLPNWTCNYGSMWFTGGGEGSIAPNPNWLLCVSSRIIVGHESKSNSYVEQRALGVSYTWTKTLHTLTDINLREKEKERWLLLLLVLRNRESRVRWEVF